MNRAACIITGCALKLEGSTHHAWGDLHIAGDRLVFVAEVDAIGDIIFTPDAQRIAQSTCVVTLKASDVRLLMRGVIIFDASPDLLNMAACVRIGTRL